MSKASNALMQFVKFSLVGVLNTLISEGVYAVLLYFNVHYLLSSFIGFSLSVLNAYYWNNKYVFKAKENAEKRIWWKVLGKTYIAYLGGYVANAGLLVFWMDILSIERFMGPVSDWFMNKGLSDFDAKFIAGIVAAGLNLMITVPMNYVINKKWAFKQKVDR